MDERKQLQAQIHKLRARADRTEGAVSGSASPSSQEWISPERRSHYLRLAADDRAEADRLEAQLVGVK